MADLQLDRVGMHVKLVYQEFNEYFIMMLEVVNVLMSFVGTVLMSDSGLSEENNMKAAFGGDPRMLSGNISSRI